MVNAVQSQSAGEWMGYAARFSPDGSTLEYSTYFGSQNAQGATEVDGIAVDGDGAAYIAGSTDAADIPTQNAIQGTRRGFSDAFIAKLSPAGSSLVYSTYLGGAGREEFGAWYRGHTIAVDADRNAYTTGVTTSTDFPTTPGAFQTTRVGPSGSREVSFVAKINATGSALGYATYLSGSNRDIPYGIGVDSSGSAFVAGVTESSNFPTAGSSATAPPFQAQKPSASDHSGFVTKMKPDGSGLAYSTFLGASDDYTELYGLAVDGTGRAYVGGMTYGMTYPTAGAVQASKAGGDDGVISVLAPDGGSVLFSTYLGGSNNDYVRAIALGPDGGIVVTGDTWGARDAAGAWTNNFPTASAVQSAQRGSINSFLTELSPMPPAIRGIAKDGETLEVSGGLWSDEAAGIVTYQWQRCSVSGATCADIPEETEFFIHVTAEDVGSSLRVRVTGPSSQGNVSATTLPVLPADPAVPGWLDADLSDEPVGSQVEERDDAIPTEDLGDGDAGDNCIGVAPETDLCGGPQLPVPSPAEPALSSRTAFSLAAPAAAPSPSVQPKGNGYGISEQASHQLADPRFAALGVTRVRLNVPFDAVLRAKGATICGPKNTAELPKINAWFKAITAASGAFRYEPLISFEHTTERRNNTKDKEPKDCRPTVRQYLKHVDAFRRKFPEVQNFTAWNEPNNSTQPFYGYANADKAGRLWRALDEHLHQDPAGPAGPLCAACKVAAGDLLDATQSAAYIKRYKDGAFRDAPARKSPRFWAYHTYYAGSHHATDKLAYFLKATKVTSGKQPYVWLTEQGGVLRQKTFEAPAARTKYEAFCPGHLFHQYPPPPNVAGQTWERDTECGLADVKYLLDDVVCGAVSGSDRITRFYLYQLAGSWYWDSGLWDFRQDASHNLETRPVYDTYKARIAGTETPDPCT